MINSTERHFRPGEYLFREGNTSDSIFLIKKGTVAIRKMKGAAFVELGRLYANEVLGELSFFDRLPRSASAMAMTEVEVVQIPFNSLDQVYAGVPTYLKTIISSVANRLRRANEVIRTLQRNVIVDEVPGASQTGALSASEALALANGTATSADLEIPSDIPIGSLDTSSSGSESKD